MMAFDPRPVDMARIFEERIVGRLDVLEQLNPAISIECMVCNGSADPQCGCDGTMTVLDAIQHINIVLEILSK